MAAAKLMSTLVEAGVSEEHAAGFLAAMPSWFNFDQLRNLIKTDVPKAIEFIQTMLVFVPQGNAVYTVLQSILAVLNALPKPA